MPTIQLNNFGGIIPRIHPTLLPYNCATKAHNCVLKNGKLVPLKEPGIENVKTICMDKLNDLNEVKTIYRWNEGEENPFVLFNEYVDCVPSNFYEDETHKFYIAGKTNEGSEDRDICVVYKKNNVIKKKSMLMIAPPAPVVTRVGDAIPEEEENIKYTFFFQTWVDELGFESEISEPSSEIAYLDGDTIKVSAWETPYLNVAKRRIYKVITDLDGNGNIQFVSEEDILFTSSELTISLKDEDAGEIYTPVTSSHRKVEGMVYVPGNFYAMWCSCSPKTVRFSSGAPNNFPDEYAYEVEYEIVGLAVIGNSIVVLTKSNPFIISGTSPEGMIVTKIPSMQGCLSKKTICVMDGIVFYISKDGLCMISEGDASVKIATSEFFSKREWKEMLSEDISLIGYDSMLFLWRENNSKPSYIFSLTDGISAITTYDEYAKSEYVDPITDKMYFIKEKQEQ